MCRQVLHLSRGTGVYTTQQTDSITSFIHSFARLCTDEHRTACRMNMPPRATLVLWMQPNEVSWHPRSRQCNSKLRTVRRCCRLMSLSSASILRDSLLCGRPSSPMVQSRQAMRLRSVMVGYSRSMVEYVASHARASGGRCAGASAVVLMSRRKAEQVGARIYGIVRGYGDASQEPLEFATTPSLAVPVALRRSGLSIEQIELFEINEAFSVVALANAQVCFGRHSRFAGLPSRLTNGLDACV